MKARFLLALSLAWNVCLGFVLIQHNGKVSEVTQVTNSAPVAPRVAISVSTNTVVKRFNWESVETDDYSSYIANLRAIGCPEETIQDIVIADVCKMFEVKKRKARKSVPRIPYWRTNSKYLGSLRAEYAAFDHKLTQPIDAERNALLRTLGIDTAHQTLPLPAFDANEYLLDFLSDEKRDQIRVLHARFGEELEAIRANASEVERQNAFLKHLSESDQRVKALLTPQEALQYDLRLSHTADTLRSELGGFEPTEQEFVQLFQIRKGYRAKLGEGNMPVAEANSAKEEMNEQIKATLGEARYADYDRVDDYGFQQIWAAAQKAGVSADAAKEAFQIRRTAMSKAKELRDANINAAKRDAALQGIREETEIALKTALGLQGWQEYGTPFNLNWLEGIWSGQH